MPQMAPINWLMLFIYFILIFFMINILNYYCFNYNKKISKKNKNKILLYWKW